LTIAPASLRRAVGVIRVSRVGDREGENFASPREQRERIEAACERDGLRLVDVLEETNVSGGDPLDRRHGLRPAVEAVEAGHVDVIVVAYFDRLVRKLTVQGEVVERVERAGGAILAVDFGEVRADTASHWLSSTMLGMVAEYQRRSTAERTAEAKRAAVERGVPPFPNVPPGYRKRRDGRLEPDRHAPAVREAFRLRDEGATINDVRAYLREHGVERSFHGVQAMLRSRIYLGELRFGSLVNERAHGALIDRATFERVQRRTVSRGRRAKSERLLARLGVLRCGTCGARMVVGTANHNAYHMYRCPPVGDCPRRVSISAEVAESAVVEAVREALEGIEGSASVAEGIEEAVRALDAREQELDAAVRTFAGFEDVDATRERLHELREARDLARERVEELQAASSPAITVGAGDWEDLTFEERRALIRAVVERATVRPGRGPDRITVEPRRQ
jgi:site-specific DNA recombinase